MSNNKQSSSIDWLINEHFGGMENCTPDFRYKIEQAKAMHKEEIINAVQSCGYIGGATDGEAEEYYLQTYGDDKP